MGPSVLSSVLLLHTLLTTQVLAASALYLSCVLWAWLLWTKESLITTDFLPLAYDILAGLLSQAEPIFWVMSQSLCRLVRSLHQPQNLTVKRTEFRHLVGLGVGLDIESSPWQSLVLPPFYVIIFPASVKCSSQTTSSQPFQPNWLPQRHFTWKY